MHLHLERKIELPVEGNMCLRICGEEELWNNTL